MLSTLLAEIHEEPAPLIAEPWVFAAIAAAIFIVLAFVTWSYRDVANRHSEKTAGQNPHDHGHQSHSPSGANH
ncbi:hypothetical protein [Protaetiibacter intestinalis]|uniref:4-hydroxybenzoate polyprenyltransferase n=1 Tax=Protaetiibacter intestinalis TaxID=2419774 RepID=A0A387B3F9_9MICO|nr:hypothetical protein [Protaetiibacter intestinalis]AYF96953.1 hypothetical protein D7I47_00910 [Protaetiibacter intestinalis]